MDTVAILGAGAWGTALAVHLARTPSAPSIRLWARDPGQVRALTTTRENKRYLPGVALDSAVTVSADLQESLAGASLLLVATPIGALIEVVALARDRAPHPRPSPRGRGETSESLRDFRGWPPLFWLGKGFVATHDARGVALAHRIVAPLWPASIGVISGPSFAEEVARSLPTAVAVAATDAFAAQEVGRRLRGETLRVYVSDDITGVEVGGAVKNVLAIAAGASDGLGFGHNARAALITRGLAETGRLSAALGGKRETLMGLAGLGDLVLTCTSDLSRNRRVGLALAKGQPLSAILSELGHVAEGVAAARDVHALFRSSGVDMPICNAVYRVLYEDLPPRRAVETLLAREPGPEFQ
ncbi:MAG: NAD(P)-dependent glycerol-3-phosphate dehydrogenase [Pseudomonadota bacterium]|nr:NAD(P)-dependent glycerol-3-phosphate dehydrogenase [Pseudomonadota bacterium]